MKLPFVALLLLFAAARADAGEWEYELDAYYTAASYTLNLTTAPIPYYDGVRESEIYKRLFTSPRPRYVIFEASVNPLPVLGVYTKRHARTFYEDMDIGDDQNLIQSVTLGFEEPAALSLFVGNVIEFKPIKKRKYGEGKGYIGYLLSGGSQHIKDNESIEDDWWETEWKVKGDRKKDDVKLTWSFRVGAKFHGNRDISDVVYLGLRRGRIDYGTRRFTSWLSNSGFLYKVDLKARGLGPVQHQLVVDRKFPLPNKRWVPTMALGFIYRTRDKYSGRLATDEKDFQLLLQPNVEF